MQNLNLKKGVYLNCPSVGHFWVLDSSLSFVSSAKNAFCSVNTFQVRFSFILMMHQTVRNPPSQICCGPNACPKASNNIKPSVNPQTVFEGWSPAASETGPGCFSVRLFSWSCCGFVGTVMGMLFYQPIIRSLCKHTDRS